MPYVPFKSAPAPSAAGVVILCLAALLQTVAADYCAKLAPSAQGSGLQYPHVCPAEQGWKMVPALWAPVEVVVNCSSSSVSSGCAQRSLPCMHALSPMLYLLCCLQLLL
jgi:hypothetical protein